MNEQTINVVFIGSGDFSIPVFRSLRSLTGADTRFTITGIVTQPDRPAGRGRILTPSPLKKALSEDPQTSSLPILTPMKLAAEADAVLEQFKPDLIVTADYGQIVPFVLLTRPRYRCLNVHPSLLPALRGATPIPTAILQGKTETGVTIQIMAEKLDAGDILEQKTVTIEPNDTAHSLEEKLMRAASDMLVDTIRSYVDGKLIPVLQDETQATFCYEKDFDATRSCLDWEESAVICEQRIRASYKKPLAWTTYRGKRIKIISALRASPLFGIQLQPGELYPASGKLFVGTHDGWLQVVTLQTEGKNPSPAEDFINGQHIGEEEFFLNLLEDDSQNETGSSRPSSPWKPSKLRLIIDHPAYLLTEFILFFLFSGLLALQPADPLQSLFIFLPVMAYSIGILLLHRSSIHWDTGKIFKDLKAYLVPTLIICIATLSLYPLSANLSSLAWLTTETWSISRNTLLIYLIAFAPLKAFIFQSFALQRSRRLGLHVVNSVIFNALLFGLAHVLLGSSYLSLSALLTGLILAAVAVSAPSLTALTIAQIAWGICLLITLG